MKNKMIFFNKWPFIGLLDAHLAKSLLAARPEKHLDLSFLNVFRGILMFRINSNCLKQELLAETNKSRFVVFLKTPGDSCLLTDVNK